MNVGEQFDIVTVSFDPTETPKLAAEKKHQYVRSYNRPHAQEGWHFLTGDADSIKKLTETVGFRYAWDAKFQQFAHASGIMVLTPIGQGQPLFLWRGIFGARSAAVADRSVGRQDLFARPSRSCCIAFTTTRADRKIQPGYHARAAARRDFDHGMHRNVLVLHVSKRKESAQR
jgi:hypothetical protein